jgi:hypothetical protein
LLGLLIHQARATLRLMEELAIGMLDWARQKSV